MPNGVLTLLETGASLSRTIHMTLDGDHENGDSDLGGAFSSIVSRSTYGCNIDHLEHIIEDNTVC